jgi:phospho-N-acetylmuramoyl-pentapeptide-transferase
VAAFLLFNWHPARLFMGDTGALALGAAITAIAVQSHLLWLLPLLGIVFVAETLSSIINVTAITRFGRRVFRASPLHHHFEELGIREERLVLLFGSAGVVGLTLTLLIAHGVAT